jgi:hypothetical protein
MLDQSRRSGRTLAAVAAGLVVAAVSAVSVAAAEVPGIRGSGSVSPYAVGTVAAGNCGVRVDMPHRSNTTPHQIHTRTESYCQTGIVESNYLRSVSYRSRWYGWEERGSASAGPVPRQWIRVTVAVDCARGGKHRWRTVGRGTAVINGRTYTAAAYEETPSELTCP